MTANWQTVGGVGEFPEGQPVCRDVGGKAVVVCRTADGLHTVLNECPHAGLPIGDGELRGRVLTCPYHGYAYDLKSGRNIDFPHEELPVKTFPTRTVDDEVQVQLASNGGGPKPTSGDEDDAEGEEPTPAADGDSPGERGPDEPLEEEAPIGEPDGYPDQERAEP